MPRTRSDLEREEKMAEIVDAARRRLLDGGYGALSVADLARELGLAQNAIYWYFPSKDDLFVAALERILHDIFSRKPKAGPLVDEVVWFADRLHEFQHLRITMRERAAASLTVASFDREVTALFRTMLVGSLQDTVAAARLGDTADAVMALCEGALFRDLGRAHRHRVIRFGFERLVG